MKRIGGLKHMASVAAVVMVLAVSQGCSTPRSAGEYFTQRGQDFLDMVDLGFTFSSKPQIGLYWNSLDLLVIGYSNVDGYFLGWGGGQFGWTRHYNYCYGFIVGRETVGWGQFDKDNPYTLYERYSGLCGLASILGSDYRRSTPDYTPGCVHFFPHLGYVGLVWNARWAQIPDFILGFACLDLGGDDGRKFGNWPWTSPDPRRN